MDFSHNGNHKDRNDALVTEPNRYHLTRDPIYYVTVASFALLTTAIPGLMGQPNFLPVIQALGLTIFTAIPLRRGELRHAVHVVAIWLTVQLLTMLLITWLVPVQSSRAIVDGFTYRSELVTWAYTGESLPRSLLANPLSRLGEIVGVLVGSLLTGGLVGSWFLVRAVDLLGYAGGALARETVAGTGLLLGITPWRLLTIAGYACFLILLAQPILTNRWNPGTYLHEQSRLVVAGTALLIAGIVFEAILPAFWQSVLGPQ